MHETDIELAQQWLLGSGIQNPAGTKDQHGKDVSGSFNAWFNPVTKSYSYIYSEISGYAMTTLTYLYKETQDARYLENARKIGDWIMTVQGQNGTIPTAFYLSEQSVQKPSEIHSFDVGMVLDGLVCLYRESQDARYLDAAKKAADWLISIQRDDGSVPAMIDAASGEIKDNNGTWSTQAGPYHAKNVIGLLNIFDVTQDPRYRDSAMKLCEYALTRQKPDGQFLTYGELDGSNLHPHTYTCEGLYVAGLTLKDDRYMEASKLGTVWALEQSRDGIVPRHKHGETLNFNERVDVLSQVLRMAALHGIQDERTDAIAEKLPRYVNHDENPATKGGFIFGKSSTGESLPHVNAWVTMFALQALRLYGKRDKAFNPYYLV
jgi:hypothetical protein